MSAIREALVAEILKWEDSVENPTERAYAQVDNFLKTPIGKRISAALVFEEALRNIENPIGFMQAEAKREGNLINGGMLIALTNDPGYYQGIARDALRNIPKLKVL